MFEENPNLIFEPLPGAPGHDAPPLVLIHDGGGTTYSYYFLDLPGRPVYGLANPHFHSGERWHGGLSEMGRHYAKLIRDVVLPDGGPVILGGWSLGGLLSLEVARVLADDAGIRVLGIIMIDSVCTLPPPEGWGDLPAPIVARKIEWGDTARPETRAAVERCFVEATWMVRDWKPPAWETKIDDVGEKEKGKAGGAPIPVPTTILLRARDRVPLEGAMMTIDLYRHDRNLGWDAYRKDLFHRVVDIPGHHFGIFVLENLDTVSEEINSACRVIEQKALDTAEGGPPTAATAS